MRAISARFQASVNGLSPATIALMLAVGLVLGVFPVYGCPTILCVAAAFVLRLNVPALLLINQLTSPLQFAMFLPLNRLGALVVHLSIALPASGSIAGAARDAIIGWLCVCAPLGIVLYLVLFHSLRRNASGSVNLVGSVPAHS